MSWGEWLQLQWMKDASYHGHVQILGGKDKGKKQFTLFQINTAIKERKKKKKKIGKKKQKYWVNLGHGVWSETQCSVFFSRVRFFNKASKRLISETPTWSQPLSFENTLEWNVLKFKKEPPVLGLLVLFVFLAKDACPIQPNFGNGLCPSKVKLWSKLLHKFTRCICESVEGRTEPVTEPEAVPPPWNQGGEPRPSLWRKQFSSG